MIRKAGYPVEAHVIKTEDGYLLTLHRIPGGNDSLPVLLLHGLTASSSKWLIPGKDKAFPYLLADQEYDVWLGNFRYYQLEDTYFPISVESDILGFQIKFFNSFDEIDIYDVSAMVTFITNLRSQPLHTCIGHSMGTTCFYIMASERPEIARMVKMMINFGPVVFLNHIQSPILGSHQEND
ncbi:Lipase 3 [Camponotus floridanus]|uniref:Lipase 3 n=3 Tax=Camponotus floridanus TaxID=104421 RepID=E2AQV2_CAMFO|nr:Lipase 3 [Camponotus floridanus]